MTSLNGLCRERVARDHEEFTRKRLMTAAESRTRIKLAARNIAEYRHVIPCSKDSEGKKITSRLGTEAVIKEYYERLFRSSMATAPGRMLTPLLENTLPFTPSEVRHAVESMPSGKCSGEDKLVVEDVRACGRPLYVALARSSLDTWRSREFQQLGKLPIPSSCIRKATKRNSPTIGRLVYCPFSTRFTRAVSSQEYGERWRKVNL
ncbi:hypothetical protein Aduo_002365 [Ancylostoma duodenale]